MFCLPTYRIVVPAVLLALSTGLRAQTAAPFSRPHRIATIGRRDSSAIVALSNAVSTSGRYQSLATTGAIAMGNPDRNPESHPCRLAILGSNALRMDVDGAPEFSSIRISPSGQKIQRRTGAPPEDLLPINRLLGPVPFSRFMHDWNTGGEEIVDYGIVETASGRRHQIGIDIPFLKARTTSTENLSVPVDIYIDPTSHALREIVYSPSVDEANGPLVVDSFSDYRPFKGVLLPTRLQEAVDGQVLWTVTLTNWSIDEELSKNEFEFDGGN